MLVPRVNFSAVARRLKLSRDHVSRVYRGETMPSVEVLIALAKDREMLVDELLAEIKVRRSGGVARGVNIPRERS